MRLIICASCERIINYVVFYTYGRARGPWNHSRWGDRLLHHPLREFKKNFIAQKVSFKIFIFFLCRLTMIFFWISFTFYHPMISARLFETGLFMWKFLLLGFFAISKIQDLLVVGKFRMIIRRRDWCSRLRAARSLLHSIRTLRIWLKLPADSALLTSNCCSTAGLSPALAPRLKKPKRVKYWYKN